MKEGRREEGRKKEMKEGRRKEGRRKEGRKNYQPKNYSYTTKINIKILKNCKRIKYQPTREEKPVKHKTTNKSRPEHTQVDSPNRKLKKNKVGINLLLKK